MFSSQKLGIRLDYPPGWAKREIKDKDYDLLLRPLKPVGASEQEISLDLPPIPFHLSGFIPLGLVESHYVDERKAEAGVPVQTHEESPMVTGEAAHLVTLTWQKDGKNFVETTILVVHDDRVYILRMACEAAAEPATRAVFDQIVKSIQWTK